MDNLNFSPSSHLTQAGSILNKKSAKPGGLTFYVVGSYSLADRKTLSGHIKACALLCSRVVMSR